MLYESKRESYLLTALTWVLRHSKLMKELAAGDVLAGVWH